MRRVHAPGDLAEAFERCRSEAEAAFGDGTVFLETLVENARHIEVQVLADGAGRWMLIVPVAEAGPGALVLFRMQRGAIAKHIGILTSERSFIHAYEGLGVVEEPLTPAWARRIALAFLFPAPSETS